MCIRDRDHTLGAEGLLAALEDSTCPADLIAVFFSNDRMKSTQSYRALLQLIGNATRRLSRNEPRRPSSDFTTQLNEVIGFRELFAPTVLTVVHPDPADRLNLLDVNPNEIAGVIRLELPTNNGDSRSVLLTADVQLTGISLMLDRDSSLLSADVLKYPHHGAWPNSWPGLAKIEPPIERRTIADFLNSIMPSTVVLSVGRANQHGHICAEAITALDEYYRKHNKLNAVCCTQVTPNWDPSSLPTDGPLADLIDCGDIEVCVPPVSYTHLTLPPIYSV